MPPNYMQIAGQRIAVYDNTDPEFRLSTGHWAYQNLYPSWRSLRATLTQYRRREVRHLPINYVIIIRFPNATSYLGSPTYAIWVADDKVSDPEDVYLWERLYGPKYALKD